ncbi:Rhomboid family protein [Pseudobythopirellula maris]|uniref:Rhomboid family protein n=1 Tax=Pseudobythopirellula maris TaxID=2527991 RepID=A0A5C5ZJN1_9BACT|nr:rhomboid family intramembrane serine protease [Pseudobythopirellula maris]TWT87436.1 Rhomboid family protein [Pseudobythopirellula maris]
MLFPLFDRNPHTRFPLVTLLLIAANVACFWLTYNQPRADAVKTVLERGFVPQRLSHVGEAQPVIVEQTIEDEKGQQRPLRLQLSTSPSAVYPTILSMMFLHGGLLHLVSNMWMLWVFGDNVEYRLGRLVFLGYYLAGGVVAVVAQWAINPESTVPVIGASGAVAAVLGGYAVSFPKAMVRTLIFIGFPLLFDLPALLVLGVWFALQMFAGIQGILAPGEVEVSVAFWAHIGGFLAGVVLMPMLALGASPPDLDWRSESEELFRPNSTDR